MTEGITARPAFLEMPDRGRRVGPPPCQWHWISLDRSQCLAPSDLGGNNAVALCRKHAVQIAVGLDYVTRDQSRSLARSEVEVELSDLRRRVATLQRTLAGATKPKKRDRPVDGVVYYIRNGWNIKIGWTSSLERRMKEYPPDTTVLAVHPGTQQDERHIHRKFAHLLTDGREWFPAAPQILEHIEIVKREHGEPEQIVARKKANPIRGPRLEQYVGVRKSRGAHKRV